MSTVTAAQKATWDALQGTGTPVTINFKLTRKQKIVMEKLALMGIAQGEPGSKYLPAQVPEIDYR